MRRLMFGALVVAATALGVVPAASAAPATPAAPAVAEAAALPPAMTNGCGIRYGPNRQAQPAGSWDQRVRVSVCDLSATQKRVTAVVEFRPRPGFAGQNVVACTAYMKIQHVVTGGSNDTKAGSCLTAARTGGGDSDPVTWDIGTGSGPYWVEGWAVVTTGAPAPYDGGLARSRTDNFAS